MSRRAALAVAASGLCSAVVAHGPQEHAAAPLCTGNSNAVGIDMLQQLAPANETAWLNDPVRGGHFAWQASDQRRFVMRDRLQGIYVAPATAPDGALGAWVRSFDGAIQPSWFGAVPDADAQGLRGHDNAPAINAAIAMAALLSSMVYVPGGSFGVAATIDLPEGMKLIGAGAGNTDYIAGPQGTSDRAGTVLVAMTPGMLVLRLAGSAVVSDISVNGEWRAAVGLQLRDEARINLSNIQVLRCRNTGYLLDATQNSTFTNCFAALNACGWTLLNGARNNNWFGCSAATQLQDYYHDVASCNLPATSTTTLIRLLIDTRRPFDFPTTQRVIAGGNDLNRFWGGIFENTACCIRVENPHGEIAANAAQGRTAFYDVEFTAARFLDTLTAVFDGSVLFDNCTFIADDQTNPVGRGTYGRVLFAGPATHFTGASALPLRGWTQPTNLLALSGTRSDDWGDLPNLVTALNTCTATMASGSGRVTLTALSHSPHAGLYATVGGPLFSGNADAVAATIAALRPSFAIQCLVEGLTETERAHIYIQGHDGRRLAGVLGNGAHYMLAPSQKGDYAIGFALGTAARQVTFSAIVIGFNALLAIDPAGASPRPLAPSP